MHTFTRYLLIAGLLPVLAHGAPPGTDTDGDGVPDIYDNCINVSNPDQRDTDGDGYGNRCDADFNNDGIVNSADDLILNSKLGTADPDTDLNGDGIVNIADYLILKSYLGKPPGPAAGGGLRWGPIHPLNGPWAIDYGDTLFGDTYDPTIFFGYNQTKGGVPILAGEPGLSLGIEGNYWFSTDNSNKMEIYIQYVDGVLENPIRPLFFSFNRQTSKLDNAFIGGTPIINFGDANNRTVNAQISRNSLIVFGEDTTQGTVVRASTKVGSGQPGALQLGFDGDDSILSIFPTAKTQAFFQIGGTNGFRYYRNPLGGSAAGSIAVGGIDDNSATGVFGSENASDNVKALVARGKSSMSANVFEVQAQDQSVVHAVDKNGVVYMTSTPSPATTPSGGVFLYVDSADNKLKYRDPSGTVHVIVTTP